MLKALLNFNQPTEPPPTGYRANRGGNWLTYLNLNPRQVLSSTFPHYPLMLRVMLLQLVLSLLLLVLVYCGPVLASRRPSGLSGWRHLSSSRWFHWKGSWSHRTFAPVTTSDGGAAESRVSWPPVLEVPDPHNQWHEHIFLPKKL